MCKSCLNQNAPMTTDRACSESHDDTCRLFVDQPCALRAWRTESSPLAPLDVEATAYELSQITAARVLPSLMSLATGSDLLAYRVTFRGLLSRTLIDELRCVLQMDGRDSHWEKIGLHTYLSVIGAGVAACVDMTPGSENLTLRYASDLENELFLAGRTLDLPRSRLFLQTALYERFDVLLRQVRGGVWRGLR